MLTPQLFSLTEIVCPNCKEPIGKAISRVMTVGGVGDGVGIDCLKCKHSLDINAYFSVEDEEEGKQMTRKENHNKENNQ